MKVVGGMIELSGHSPGKVFEKKHLKQFQWSRHFRAIVNKCFHTKWMPHLYSLHAPFETEINSNFFAQIIPPKLNLDHSQGSQIDQ